jgi:tetratricopeptide (TPR) repeat protein
MASLPGCLEAKKETPSDLEEARRAMMTRDYLEAEKSFERYLRRTPQGSDRWEVWNCLVDLALSVRNDRKAAIELLEAMLIEYADSPARKRIISSRLAEQCRLARNYERALALWSAIAEDKSVDVVERARVCRNLASVYLRRLEFELAKESLGYCLAFDLPDAVRANCLYDLAQTYVGIGDLDKAITSFRSVLALGDIPGSERTLAVFMLADTLDQKGASAEALKLFTSISEDYPNPKVVEQRIAFLKNKRKTAAAQPSPEGRR